MKHKLIAITIWLICPLIALAYHYGPGQQQLKLDQADDLLAQSEQAVKEENWEKSIDLYNEALSKLPKEKVHTARLIQVQIAKAKMQNAKLPEARRELASLVTEINNDPSSPRELKEEALATLANSRYYMTYLMKLEGKPDSEWEPEIEAARQEYKLLAQTAEKPSKHLLDLEASIRLARATPQELYGLPIPNQ